MWVLGAAAGGPRLPASLGRAGAVSAHGALSLEAGGQRPALGISEPSLFLTAVRSGFLRARVCMCFPCPGRICHWVMK